MGFILAKHSDHIIISSVMFSLSNEISTVFLVIVNHARFAGGLFTRFLRILVSRMSNLRSHSAVNIIIDLSDRKLLCLSHGFFFYETNIYV